MEEEELLIPSNQTVIALLGLLTPLKPLSHLLVLSKGDTVDTLEDLIFSLSEPIAGGIAINGHGLDPAGVGDVGTQAEIDQGSAPVDGAGRAVGDLLLDEVGLHVVVLDLKEVRRVKDQFNPIQVEELGEKPTWNISRSSSLVISRRSKSCFSVTICLQSLSRTGKSFSETVSSLTVFRLRFVKNFLWDGK
jgi:hypothetical protein